MRSYSGLECQQRRYQMNEQRLIRYPVYLDQAGVSALFEDVPRRKGVKRATRQVGSERMLDVVIQYLTKKGHLVSVLSAAVGHARASGAGTFIEFTAKFNAPQFTDGFGFDQVLSERAYVFEHVSGLNTVQMAAGLEHTGGLTSHMAVYMRAHGAKGIRFNVFGYFTPISDRVFQIKPYAIRLP